MGDEGGAVVGGGELVLVEDAAADFVEEVVGGEGGAARHAELARGFAAHDVSAFGEFGEEVGGPEGGGDEGGEEELEEGGGEDGEASGAWRGRAIGGKRFLRAGYHGENDAVNYFGAKAFLAICLPALAVILKFAVMKAMPAQQFLMLLAFSVLAGFYLPDYYLYAKTRERKKKILEGFPDALDLMVVCVEAGMALDAAIKRVGDEMSLKNKELSDEFKMLSLELRGGKARPDALRNLAMRTDLDDVVGLVTLLVQTDRFGTRVAQALRVHSDSMRSKRYLRAEEMAAKIPVKILFPLVLFILPALVMTLLGPGVIKFYRIIVKGSGIS